MLFTWFGDKRYFRPEDASLGGFIFLVALDIIDIMLMQTEDTLSAGLQSEYKIDRHMNPLL